MVGTPWPGKKKLCIIIKFLFFFIFSVLGTPSNLKKKKKNYLLYFQAKKKKKKAQKKNFELNFEKKKIVIEPSPQQAQQITKVPTDSPKKKKTNTERITKSEIT